jgi:hypothetical protein
LKEFQQSKVSGEANDRNFGVYILPAPFTIRIGGFGLCEAG